jgi:hypothetical protein
MKIFYIANARMPTEKAYGIQIAKMYEAFKRYFSIDAMMRFIIEEIREKRI